MNRKHTAKEYFQIIDKLRSKRSDIAFSSDFIVGFPGETDADFKATLEMVKQVKFAQAYSFKYSPRPGTPAANIAEQVPEQVQSERLQELQDLITKQQIEFNKWMIGKIVPVLFTRRGREAGQIHGKTTYMQSIHVNAPEKFTSLIMNVEIKEAFQNGVSGIMSDSQIQQAKQAA